MHTINIYLMFKCRAWFYSNFLTANLLYCKALLYYNVHSSLGNQGFNAKVFAPHLQQQVLENYSNASKALNSGEEGMQMLGQ